MTPVLGGDQNNNNAKGARELAAAACLSMKSTGGGGNYHHTMYFSNVAYLMEKFAEALEIQEKLDSWPFLLYRKEHEKEVKPLEL